MPTRGGLSVVKATHQAGGLSPLLGGALASFGAHTVDRDPLTRVAAEIRRHDLRAAAAVMRQVIRPGWLSALRGLGTDLARLHRRTGLGRVRQVLALADDPDDLRRAAQLTDAKALRNRGTLALLGRGTLVAGGLTLSGIGWLLSAVLCLVGMLAFAMQEVGLLSLLRRTTSRRIPMIWSSLAPFLLVLSSLSRDRSGGPSSRWTTWQGRRPAQRRRPGSSPAP